MNEDIFKSFFPTEYNQRFLQNKIRNDSRSFDQLRRLEIYTKINGRSLGSSMIKYGKTIVMCSIEGNIIKKSISKITYASEKVVPEKYLDIQIILGKNEEYEQSKKGKFAKESFLSTWIQKNISLAFPDLEKKLIIPNTNSAWRLNAIIKVVNDDGNIYDAAYLSLLTALLTIHLPKIKNHLINEDKFEFEADQFTRIEFEKNNIQVPLTFRMINEYIILDPNYAEEDVEGANISLIFNREGEFIISKWSTCSIEHEKLQEVIDMGIKKSKDYFKILDQILDKNFQNKITTND